MKGQSMKFDEFGIVILGGVIFLGILALAFTTPSEFPPKVVPTSVTLNLDPGSYDTFNVNITGRISGVNVSTSGEIASWLQPAEYDLGALTEKRVLPIGVNVPSTASSGAHRGKVVVQSKEGRAETEVTVFVSAVKRLTSRTLPMGDFRVSYQSGTRTVDGYDGETFVSKSYLYERPLTLVGTVEPEEAPILVGGRVRFAVDDTNNYGGLIVTQNGRQIFNELVGPGEVIVPLNASDLGRTTTVRVTADNPGIFFWAESVYAISDAALDLDYSGPIVKTFNFTLAPEEYGRFDHAQVTFSVAGATSNIPPLRIKLNDQVVFFGSPPLTAFNRNFERDTFGGPIRVGAKNSLTFSFDQEASYEVSDATLVVYTRAS